MLEILKNKVHARDDRLVIGCRRIAGRFDGQMQGGLLMQAVGQFREEVRLHERLAAGKGDASAGGGEDVGVRKKLVSKLGNGPTAPADDFRPLRAGPCESRQVVRRNIPAVAAANALTLLEKNFWLRRNPLRVVAPGAAKGTTLEKDGSTYAWPVVQAEFPYLEDERCPLNVHARSIAQTAVMW